MDTASVPRGSDAAVIGTASDADADACLELYRRVLAEDRWFITRLDEFTGTQQSQARMIRSLNEADNGRYFVARIGPRIVGVLSVQGGRVERNRHVGKLEILVDPDWRGEGIGRSLLEAAVTWARANPILQKLGLSVFEDNDRARSLYEHAGFAIEGRREGEYRESTGELRNDLLMCCWV